MNKAAVRFYRLIRKQILKKSSLMSIGKGCVNLIDVGSAGDLPSPWLENAVKIKYLLQFEPRSIPGTSAYITSLNFALGSEENQRDLYVYKGFGGSGSSFYKQTYEYVGEESANILYCEQIQDERTKDICYANVAKKLFKPELCEEIKKDNRRDSCYMSFVTEEKKDFSVCDKVTNQYLKQSCSSLKQLSDINATQLAFYQALINETLMSLSFE